MAGVNWALEGIVARGRKPSVNASAERLGTGARQTTEGSPQGERINDE